MAAYFEADTGDGRRVVLTPRERDVLSALCDPLFGGDPFPQPASTRAIAQSLVVTEAAVKQHLLHLYDKFGIPEGADNRRLRLATEAVRVGIVALDGSRSALVTRASAPDRRVRTGHAALLRRAWAEAYDALAAADAVGPLTATDLNGLAEAALWTGRVEEATRFRERAHAAAIEAGESATAVRTALGLVFDSLARVRPAVAWGWIQTARHILDTHPDDHEEGRYCLMVALLQTATSQSDAGLSNARAARAAGRRHSDPELEALGIVFEGFALVQLGEVGDGTSLLDEAMARASTGALGPRATGLIYCRTLAACLALHDYRRASEWTDTILERGREIGTIGFAGDCRTHRIVLHLIRGEWEEGSQEAELACSETLALDMNHTGLAFYELGEIRLRQGDLAAAAEAFRRANELGADALPGTALLRLAEGDADAAAAALASAVEDASSDRLRRARLLPALVEAALARGDIDTARLAASDLAEVAEAVDSHALRAAATTAHGATLIASGDLAAAQRSLRAGVRGWLELGAPHEAAQARLALARALAARGDQMSAVMEVEAALATFDRLGARRDRETAEDLLSELDRPAAIT